jgi:hypothetical protein
MESPADAEGSEPETENLERVDTRDAMKSKSNQCDLCDYRSSSKGGITSHRRYVHAIYPERKSDREIYRGELPPVLSVKETPAWAKEMEVILPSLPENP